MHTHKHARRNRDGGEEKKDVLLRVVSQEHIPKTQKEEGRWSKAILVYLASFRLANATHGVAQASSSSN